MPQPDTSRRVSHGASRFSGLQTKILALVLIPLFLVAAVLVTVASLEQRAATEQALAEQQRQLTQARKDKVQSIVESAHSTITPLLNDPTLSNQAIRQRVYELLQNVRFDIFGPTTTTASARCWVITRSWSAQIITICRAATALTLCRA
ncbi:MAG: hypothetical protein L0J54_02600 [Halomonas sp.]|nr:hypothetical protein [Halomonas sp.]MDN6296900.1 hypothetical protein [Halomonas sp.]MDN6314382.1 hypothetical protein [Halomonas sp.]MDN6335658.1 hypothetical protein [Halomonas sp.]